jgi:hypothetical protein
MLLEATGPYFARTCTISQTTSMAAAMQSSVTVGTKRNQIERCVVTELTSSFQVVDVKVP